MKLCNNDCIPCCDFCVYVIRENIGRIVGGPNGCKLHLDEDHQEIAKSCHYCEDFQCFNTIKIKGEQTK